MNDNEIKVSQLNEATELNDNDIFMVVQEGVNKKIKSKKIGGNEVLISDDPTEITNQTKLYIDTDTGTATYKDGEAWIPLKDNEVIISDTQPTSADNEIWVDTSSNETYINSEIAIGSSNDSNTPVWFKQGKNLFGNYTIVNGYISTPAFMRIRDTLTDRLAFIPCKPNTTYTISRNIITTRFRVGEYTDIPNMTNANQDFNLPQNIIDNNSGTDMTYTTTATAKYLIIMYANTTEDSNIGQALDGIQVEKGNTATTFEDYIIPEIHTDKEIYQEEIKTRLAFYYNGTHEAFTLNDDIKHYKEIEITFGRSSWSAMKQKVKVVPQQSGTTPCGLFAMYPSSTSSAIVVGGALMEIGSSGTNVSFPRMLGGSITETGYVAESNVYLNVYEVVGYK